jgi:hypothetical protein
MASWTVCELQTMVDKGQICILYVISKTYNNSFVLIVNISNMLKNINDDAT